MDNGRYSVLLVDDDLVQMDMARLAAAETRPEIDLSIAAGGDAVLHWFSTILLEKLPMPDVILMDLKLPRLDGLAVLRKLRELPSTGEIPVVVFSAEYTQAEVLMSYKAGANSFVAKPADVAGYAEIFRDRLAYWMHPQQHKLFPSAQNGAAELI